MSSLVLVFDYKLEVSGDNYSIYESDPGEITSVRIDTLGSGIFEFSNTDRIPDNWRD